MPEKRTSIILAAGLAALMALPAPASADGPRVAVTIKPLHSLVAAVMEGVAAPALLVPAGDSPHTHAVRPSEAHVIENAGLVFWIGPALEVSYAKTLRALAEGEIVTMVDQPGLEVLPVRESGLAAYAHEDESAEHAKPEGLAIDPHIWLDPVNAKAMAAAIAAALAGHDPENAETYRANAEKLKSRLDALDAELEAELAPVREIPFLTYHAAYQYFVRHYGLNDIGAIAVSPEQQPGLKRLRELRGAITGGGVVCVFTEPQFEPALARRLVEGTDARLGTLDPESRPEIPPGPGFYFALMRGLSRDLRACLSPSGG